MNKEKFIGILNKYGLKCLDKIPENFSEWELFNVVDRQGYKYRLSACQMAPRKHIVWSTNPYNIENIQHYIYLNGGNAKLLTKEWTCATDKLRLVCGQCGREYEARWYHVYANHKFTCNKCSKAVPYNRKNQEETEQLCQKHGYHILEGTYVKRKQFDMVDKQGYKYSNSSVHNLAKRNNHFARFSYKNKYQIENIETYARLNNLPIKLVEGQKNFKADDYIELYCAECGEKFKTHWGKIINEKSHYRGRCRKCSSSQSNLEYTVETYLKLQNIEYECEKRFPWCRKVYNLPFDFYLPQYNTVIEVQGEQHYHEVDFFKRTLLEQQEMDTFKKECCIKNGFNYVEISYKDIESVKEKYKEIIDNITAIVTK